MFVVLFVLWVIFNGKLNWEIAAFGAALSALVYAFSCAFLGYSFKAEIKAVRKLPQYGRYLGLVFCEVIKSNLALIRVVYSPRVEVKPKLVKFTTPLKGAYKAVLSDSITLTPGTITVECEEETLTVHSLDESFADGIENTDFQKQLLEMQQEGEAQQ